MTKTHLQALFLLALALLSACSAPGPIDHARERVLWTDAAYPTADVDAVGPGGETPSAEAQAVIDATAACLADLPAVLPESVQSACGAYPWAPADVWLDTDRLDVRIELGGLSDCTQEQVLPWAAPSVDPRKATCAEADGVAHWRSMVRGDTLLTTPDLRMLPDAVVRWSTSCQNPWAVPELVACAAPYAGGTGL